MKRQPILILAISVGAFGIFSSACSPPLSQSTALPPEIPAQIVLSSPTFTSIPSPTQTPTPTQTSTPTPDILATFQQRSRNATATVAAQIAASRTALFQGLLILRDSFDSNEHSWPAGTFNDQFHSRRLSISEGKYRLEIKAHRDTLTTVDPSLEALADFSVKVDAQLINAPQSVSYGIVFRKSGNNFYFFYVNNEKWFSAGRYDHGEWVDLIDGTNSSLILVDQVKQLAVVGVGARFQFFINGEFVAEGMDGRLKTGEAGLAVGLEKAGDQVVVEFDNFEVREIFSVQAACPNGAPLGNWILYVVKASSGRTSILVDGEPTPVNSGENMIYLSSDITHTIQVGSQTLNLSVPECGENTLNLP